MISNLVDEIQRLRELGEPYALAIVVRAEKPTSAKPGAAALVTAGGKLTGWIGGSCAEPMVRDHAIKALADGIPRLLRLCPPEAMGQGSQEGVTEIALSCISGGTYEIYIEPQMVQPNLIILGHLATSEALVRLANAMGYPTTVMGWDVPRSRFELADQLLEGIDFADAKISSQTFIVVASHGNYDEPALEAALRTNAPYVTLIASPRRAEAIFQYLHDSDLPEGWQERFKYPAGLDIGAVTEDEIALSILGEIIQIRRRKGMLHAAHPPADHGEAQPTVEKDPVCGMMVEVATARHTSDHEGKTYYFCAAGCKRAFETSPEDFLVKE